MGCRYSRVTRMLAAIVRSTRGEGGKGLPKIVMLGMDGSGKTTMFNYLSQQSHPPGPTVGFNLATVATSTGRRFTLWDCGGQEYLRRQWQYYLSASDAVMFVTDSAAIRQTETRVALRMVLSMCEGRPSVPVVVVANKQDLDQAMDVTSVAEVLGLTDTTRPWTIVPTSATAGVGVQEALDQVGRQVLLARGRSRLLALVAGRGSRGRRVNRAALRTTHSPTGHRTTSFKDRPRVDIDSRSRDPRSVRQEEPDEWNMEPRGDLGQASEPWNHVGPDGDTVSQSSPRPHINSVTNPTFCFGNNFSDIYEYESTIG